MFTLSSRLSRLPYRIHHESLRKEKYKSSSQDEGRLQLIKDSWIKMKLEVIKTVIFLAVSIVLILPLGAFGAAHNKVNGECLME